MRDLFTSYHSPSLALPASLPLLAFPRCVTFVCHGWRTETDVCSAARLSISLCLHDCDSHRLLPTSRKTSRVGFSSSPCSSSSGLSVRRFGLLRVRPVKLLHSHGPPISRPASRKLSDNPEAHRVAVSWKWGTGAEDVGLSQLGLSSGGATLKAWRRGGRGNRVMRE